VAKEIIDDANATAKDIKRVLICSGKVYYDLLAFKKEKNDTATAIVRMEQLYPYPEQQVEKIFAKYKSAKFMWVQEESANMGSWSYLMRFWRNKPIELVSRKTSASPATGFKKVHDKQQVELVEKAFNS